MKNIVIKGWMVAIAVFVVMFGGIYLTIGTGHWATSREAEPIKLETGEYDPADIRGSYTFAELEEFFAVPANLLFEAFMIPEELRKPTFQIKNMEGLFAPVIIDGTEIEVGTDLIRVFTSLYTGIPYESSETTHLPSSAVAMLNQEKKLDAEQTAYWQTHVFELVPAGETPAEPVEEKHAPTPAEEAAPAESPQAEETPPSSPEEKAETSIEIKGSTTIGGLLDAGMTQEQFREITGVEMPDDTAMRLKDFADANGLDMETLKDQIIEALQQYSNPK